jgi:hypothetical protein
MNKGSKKPSDSLRKEYDLSKIENGVRGKYYSRATADTNLVLIDPDLTGIFPDGASVNRALRLLADAAMVVAAKKPSPSSGMAAGTLKRKPR